MSLSMHRIRQKTIQVFNSQLKTIQTNAKQSTQKTLVNVYTFSSSVDKPRARNKPANKVEKFSQKNFKPGGMTALLDATEAGRTVYGPLGFQDLYTISRWEHACSPGARAPDEANTAIRPLSAADLDGLTAWDHTRSGARRARVLGHCWQAAPHLAHLAEDTGGNRVGYGLGRPGHRATQLGPIIADDAATAELLIQHVLARITGLVYIDVPDAQTAFKQALIDAGFTRQRGFMRMAKGAAAPLPRPTSIYAIAGPDLG